MWCAALSHAMSRFEGCRPLYKTARSGGVGSFTADNFPVFDWLKPNVYAILDSNHGYKMIGVGREVARGAAGRALVARSTRSASSASRPATSTRSRTRPTPGRSAGNHRLGAPRQRGRPAGSDPRLPTGHVSTRATGRVAASAAPATTSVPTPRTTIPLQPQACQATPGTYAPSAPSVVDAEVRALAAPRSTCVDSLDTRAVPP